MEMRRMKFSEAIRTGAKNRPQAFNHLFGEMRMGGIRGSCAMGAAMEGLFGGHVAREPNLTLMHMSEAMAHTYKKLLHRVVRCPQPDPGDLSELTVARMIEHLNDQHHWSREKIADWVAGIEAEVEREAEFKKMERIINGPLPATISEPELVTA